MENNQYGQYGNPMQQGYGQPQGPAPQNGAYQQQPPYNGQQGYYAPPANGAYYGQPVYGAQLMDPGEKYASNAKLFGILSLFVLPIVFCILGLVNYSNYQKMGDGSHQSDANVGRVCSIISIILQGLGILFTIIYIALIGSFVFMY